MQFARLYPTADRGRFWGLKERLISLKTARVARRNTEVRTPQPRQATLSITGLTSLFTPMGK